MHINGGGNIDVNRDMEKKPGSSAHFPKRTQDARHGSSEYWPALKQIAPLITAVLIVKKNKIKN